MSIDDIALVIANIQPKDAVYLTKTVGGARELLSMQYKDLSALGLSSTVIDRLKAKDLYERAEQELDFIEKYRVRPLLYGSPEYPKMLEECIDAPYMLFVKGDIDFNANNKWLSVVGTRNNTPYGISFTETFIRDISKRYQEAVIVSGLAYGTDSVAHRSALSNNLQTVAVLAHGLKTIYPVANRSLASRIIEKGGALVTEFPSYVQPLRHAFLQRNRIVAGLSIGTVVVESPFKGGSMSTANIADSYSRDVFAVPGRINDENSAGCNNLIRNSKAGMVCSLADVEAVLGWEMKNKQLEIPLFEPALEGSDKVIYDLLKNGEKSADQLIEESGLSAGVFSSLVCKLEIMGFVRAVRGKMYIRL
ncbi:MAG: DNA-protecting protein DprA [Bacteroidetes bacterium]|nr:DNA-protecting protein DprA [Bacteroidota bacterium]